MIETMESAIVLYCVSSVVLVDSWVCQNRKNNRLNSYIRSADLSMYDRPVFYRVHLFETVVVSPTGMREPGVIINPFEYLMTPFHQPVNIKSKVRTHPL